MAEPAFNCGYCQGATGHNLFSGTDTAGHRWSWALCPDCGAVSLTPRPTPAELSAAYDTSYYGETETKFEGSAEGFIESCRRARARRLARELPANAQVLDVGCGNGGFLAALGDCGKFRRCGVELDGPAAQRAARRPGLELTTGELRAGAFPDGSFDLVTLFHVFEHLPEPRATLSIIHRILKPTGRLTMSFPNISSVQARLFRGKWLHLDPPRHLFLFPRPAFERAIAEAGFGVVERRCFSIEQNPFGFIQSALNCVLPRELLLERMKGNRRYAPNHGALSVFLQKALAGLCLGPAIALDAIESAFGRGATVEYSLRKMPDRP